MQFEGRRVLHGSKKDKKKKNKSKSSDGSKKSKKKDKKKKSKSRSSSSRSRSRSGSSDKDSRSKSRKDCSRFSDEEKRERCEHRQQLAECVAGCSAIVRPEIREAYFGTRSGSAYPQTDAVVNFSSFVYEHNQFTFAQAADCWARFGVFKQQTSFKIWLRSYCRWYCENGDECVEDENVCCDAETGLERDCWCGDKADDCCHIVSNEYMDAAYCDNSACHDPVTGDLIDCPPDCDSPDVCCDESGNQRTCECSTALGDCCNDITNLFMDERCCEENNCCSADGVFHECQCGDLEGDCCNVVTGEFEEAGYCDPSNCYDDNGDVRTCDCVPDLGDCCNVVTGEAEEEQYCADGTCYDASGDVKTCECGDNPDDCCNVVTGEYEDASYCAPDVCYSDVDGSI